MATQLQYDFFKLLLDEEDRRYSELEARARLYFTVLSFYIGAVAFKLKDLAEWFEHNRFPLWLAIVGGAIFSGALLFCVLAIQIATYESVNDPRAVASELDAGVVSDDDFRKARLADFVVATTRNAKVNDRTASFLAISAMLMLIGVAFQFVLFAVAIAG